MRRSCSCGRDGERVDDARQPAEADDAVVGHVGDVRDADERQQVVLADRAELDVAQQHDARPVARRRRGDARPPRCVERVVAEAGEELRVRLGDPPRRRRRAGARRVLADRERASRRRPPRCVPGRRSGLLGRVRGVRRSRCAGSLARARRAALRRRRLGVDAAVDDARVDRRLGRDRRSAAGRDTGACRSTATAGARAAS